MRSAFLYQLGVFIFLFNALNPVYAKEVTIEGTQERVLYSQKVNQQYQLLINLPMGFDKNNSYPVIYLLDAQWDFPLIFATYGQLYFDGFLPAAVIVGITWGGEGDDPNVKRVRDFTPSNIAGDIESGGAANFLAFIKDELIPFVEQEYSGNEQRVLMGSSLGGLFTLYALFNEPQLFSGYIPTASASGWDNDVLYRFAKSNDAKLRAQLAKQPINLYSAVGELDHLKTDFANMQAFFTQQHYSGLHLKTDILGNLGHAGIKAPGNVWGLQFVFQKADLTLTASELNRWQGKYQSTISDEIVTVSLQQGRLSLQRADGLIANFHNASASTFYQKGQLYQLRFSQVQAFPVNLTIERFGMVEEFIHIID
jgi:predicted alpha/beta superfamily hydrolase